MASGKETPRQKMIGMMYLVLTALLALNVSKDILNAFIVVDNGLAKTNTNFDGKNQMTYTAFDLAMLNDEVKTKPFFDKANVAKQLSKDLDKYIMELKSELYQHVEGVPKEVADTMTISTLQSKDNYDIPTHYLIGENPENATGKAKELKEKINKFKDALKNLVPQKERANLQLGLSTEDVYSSTEQKIVTWENNAFYHSPMAAVITILSKIQNDIKNAEGDVINLLFRSVSAADFKFDTLAAKVIANTNYVLLGEEYKADVFVAAFSTTQNPQVWLGNVNESNTIDGSIDSTSIAVDRGVGKYLVRPNSEGLKKWSGIINVKSPDNTIKSYPFKSEYFVAKPALTVSAEKMNVLYMGVENPISISVPGIANELLNARIDVGQLTPLGNGKYKVTNVKGNKASINVTAKMENGENKNIGAVEFRVRPLPSPYVRLGEVTGKGKMKKNMLKNLRGLISEYDRNFDFEITSKITYFEMTTSTRGMFTPEIKSSTNAFTDDMKNAFDKLKAGDKVFFENIKAVGPDGIPRTLGAITIDVIN